MSNSFVTGSDFEAGFTLVELITVIVIVAVLGMIAMPRYFDNRAFAERGYYEELVSALRYSQSAAVNTGCPVRFVLTGTNFLAEQQQALGGRCDPADSSWGQPVRLADGSTVSGTAPAGVSAAPAVNIVFGALGTTALGADQLISVGPFTLTVQAASGYVDVP